MRARVPECFALREEGWVGGSEGGRKEGRGKVQCQQNHIFTYKMTSFSSMMFGWGLSLLRACISLRLFTCSTLHVWGQQKCQVQ